MDRTSVVHSLRRMPLRVLGVAGVMALVGACNRGVSVVSAPSPKADDRVGLKAGLYDAGEAAWNLKKLASVPSPQGFAGVTNSDLAFTGNYAIQGNYNGFQIWDVSNPAKPTLRKAFLCPASQSDVSVYKNLLFVSGEGNSGRLDCGTQGVREVVSKERLRGIRIFDISDIDNPKYVANVQTCRGSHTHSVLADPKDPENVYIYISGSAGVRPDAELPGCVNAAPDKDPNSALFRIEVIKVPVAHPEQAAIVASPRIFKDLTGVGSHGSSPEEKADIQAARARGQFVVALASQEIILPPAMTNPMLDSVMKARGGSGTPSAADSAALNAALPRIMAQRFGITAPGANTRRPGPNQCHDITVYPGLGLAGGACEGMGLLLDISNPANPVRIDAVADTNFSYWHSATFNNDGTKVLFSDEWGGGGAPKCRANDPKEWGADAIFTIGANKKMDFKSYYKITAPQTKNENCVAHNGSLIPIPGRDVMVQAWYQGGISIFDWTDASKPFEIAHHDRGPVDSTRMAMGGSWSVYWYNGSIVSSEIARGLDVFDLTPSEFLTQNEIDAAKTVHLDYLNAQGQPKFTWPPSFALARAYVDQLERSKCMSAARVSAVRASLSSAERASGTGRRDALSTLASGLGDDARSSCDGAKVSKLQQAVRDLAAVIS